jgi:hypothetical protein
MEKIMSIYVGHLLASISHRELQDDELDAARGGSLPLPARMTALLAGRSNDGPSISEFTIAKYTDSPSN